MNKLWLRDMYAFGKWSLPLALALYPVLLALFAHGGMGAPFMMLVIYFSSLGVGIMVRDELRNRHTLMLALPVTRRALAIHRYTYVLAIMLALALVLTLFLSTTRVLAPSIQPLQLLLLSLMVISLYVVCFVPPTLAIGGAWGITVGVGLLVAAHIVIDALARHAWGGARIPESCEVAAPYEDWLAWLLQAWRPATIVMLVAGLIAVHGLALWLTVKGFERREA